MRAGPPPAHLLPGSQVRLRPRPEGVRCCSWRAGVGEGILIIAVGSLALGLLDAPQWGWGSARLIAALAVSAAGLRFLVLRSSRARPPIIDLALFRDRTFSASNIAALAFYADFGVDLLALVLWPQDGSGRSADSSSSRGRPSLR
ncbi:hypothetical protein Sm713_41390 [Streptomyces sp. TS71-3]|nr:hypothetical protein Sm713_41390 [Streptomyces sp. TS71-3]